MHNYWLLGADWSGADQKETFFTRGYWEIGYTDEAKPAMAKLRDQIAAGDRVAIKRRRGHAGTGLLIQALGIVKDVSAGKVYIDWLLTDLEREVESKGAMATIHGPYRPEEDAGVARMFCV